MSNDSGGKSISAPAGFVPAEAMVFDDGTGKAVAVSPANPLPVAGASSGSGVVSGSVVASGDQTWTVGQPYPLPLTPTGRVRVGLSSAAQEGGAVASYADLMGVVAADGTQRSLKLGTATKASSLPVTLASDGAGAAIGNATDAASGLTDGTAVSLIAALKYHSQMLAQLHADLIAATPAGALIIGKVGVDQTTQGSTNLVTLGSSSGIAAAWTNDASDTAAQSAASNGLKTLSRTTVFDGSSNWIRARGDANGAVNQPYALASSRWAYAAPAGGTSSTTAATMMAAGGTGVRNYLTSLKIIYGSLTTATELVVRDGAGGTVLYRDFLPTGAAGRASLMFDNPLRGTANTLMEVALLTAPGAAVYINANGFQGA